MQSTNAHIHRIFAWYTLGVIIFVLLLIWLESKGLSRDWVGITFLVATLAVYATIGIICRTTDPAQYYVAGRQIPAFYNGMATAADWMSAASFIGLAGALYIGGYGALAFIMGWTGGYCLVALLVAPYLRKFGQFTVPDFFAARYGGRWPRVIAACAAIGCSFVYVVAQIYAVGLIASRLTGVAFEVGIFLGLGGVLLCSFLGGMRAITWTQVAQYIVMIIAFSIPVVWLSVKQTGSPFSLFTYSQQLQKITERERVLASDPQEIQVVSIYQQRVKELDAKLANPSKALADDRKKALARVADLKASNAPLTSLIAAEKALRGLPKDEQTARQQWLQARNIAGNKSLPLGGMPPHGQQFSGDPSGDAKEKALFDGSRRNFLALVVCLMLGTAALPHVLTRYYTTPSVAQARTSVTWSLFFILLLYLAVPALAILVKYEVFHHLVGTPIESLPQWIAQWNKVDPSLVSVVDINADGILQLGELFISSDIIMLATPEIAGLPYVISGLVAAGGLAAALSTADGLLLTMSSALSHDLYHSNVSSESSNSSRVVLSKMLLLVVALVAAYVAAQKPGDIVFMVAAAFSLAASVFFVPLVAGIFWRRANAPGALSAMVVGATTTLYYMVCNHPGLRAIFSIEMPVNLWWSITPLASGVFGVPAALSALVIVSLCTRAPTAEHVRLVDTIRSCP